MNRINIAPDQPTFPPQSFFFPRRRNMFRSLFIRDGLAPTKIIERCRTFSTTIYNPQT